MRHAASVDSEPGSNSQVEYISLRVPKGALRTTSSTREPYLALALCYEFSVRLILDVFPRLLSYLVFKEPSHEWGLPARGTAKDSTLLANTVLRGTR